MKTDLFHAEGQTARKMLIVALYHLAKAPKKGDISAKRVQYK
jgi:glucose-6-phosphate 1-dehydrogenase